MTRPELPSPDLHPARPTALAVVLVRALEIVESGARFKPDGDLVQLIEVEPVLRGVLSRIVRCPVYGPPARDDGIVGHLERLGHETVAEVFRHAAPPTAAADDATLESHCRAWCHGVAVAAAARWLSNQGAYDDPDEAYIAGLAHALCHGVEHPGESWTGAAPESLHELRLGARVEAVVRLSHHFGSPVADADLRLDGVPVDSGVRRLFRVVARGDELVDALGFASSQTAATISADEGEPAAVAEAVSLELAHTAALLDLPPLSMDDLVREMTACERRARVALAAAAQPAAAPPPLVRVADAYDGLLALRTLTSIPEILERGIAQLHACLRFDRLVVLEREHGKPSVARVRSVACRTRTPGPGPRSLVEFPVPDGGGLIEAFDGDHARRSTLVGDDAALRFLGTGSFAVAPLRAGSCWVGVIVGDHFVERRTVDDDEVTALGVAASTLGVVLENAALQAEGKTLRALAEKDALTGINNRRNVLEILRREIDRARRYGKPLAVALLDVDHFKSWNDLHGHQVGDMVLQTVAQIISSASREVDACGRYGGEEFLIVLPETGADHAVLYAERLRAAIEAHGVDLAAVYPPALLTVSIGVTQLLPRGDDDRQMIQRADNALYAAKAHGRNRVCVEWVASGTRTAPPVRAPGVLGEV